MAFSGAAQGTHSYVSMVIGAFVYDTKICPHFKIPHSFETGYLTLVLISFFSFIAMLKLYRNFAVVLLKIAAEICICLKIEYPQLSLSIYTVMIPIWILLPSTIIYVSINLLKNE